MSKINLLIKKSFANFLTLINMFMGFSSIVLIALSFSNNNYINWSCNLILIATLIDVLDGKIARKLGTSGDFGKEIDSLADLVTFCVAPSFLIFYYYYDLIQINLILLVFLCSLTLLFGSIRLARFNVYSEQSDNLNYLGLPTPANAIFVSSMVLYMYNIQFFDLFELPSFISITDNSMLFILNYPLSFIFTYNEYVILFFYIITSILLISKVKYSKFPQLNFKQNKNNTVSLIGIMLFFGILFFGILTYKHDIVLLFFILVYILTGILYYFYHQIIKKRVA